MTVKLFALLRERAGAAEVTLGLPAAATVSAAREMLAKQIPSLSDALGRAAYAVNREYASPDTQLHEGDELAVIPPVSGG